MKRQNKWVLLLDIKFIWKKTVKFVIWWVHNIIKKKRENVDIKSNNGKLWYARSYRA